MLKTVRKIMIKVLELAVGFVYLINDLLPVPLAGLFSAAVGIAVAAVIASHWSGFWSPLITGVVVTGFVRYFFVLVDERDWF